MTSEQQAAYWKHQSRKHEDRVKSFGDLTTDQLKDLRDKASRADKLDYDLSSATDKAVADARRETEREVGDRLRSQLVDTAFRIAVGDRKTADEVADFISDLNLSRFLNADGSVDTAKVLARVDQFAPATGNQQQRPAGPSASGQGNRSGGNGSRPGTGSVGSGADLYREMHPAKK